MNNGDSFRNEQDAPELPYGNHPGIQDIPTFSQDSAPPPPPSDGGIPYYGEALDGSDGHLFSEVNPEQHRRNKFNIAALVLGLSSFASNLICLSCLSPFAAILAIIFGCVGRAGRKFDPKGLAGFILGIVYCALLVLSFLFILFVAILSVEEGTEMFME